jgi:hypothetical protein
MITNSLMAGTAQNRRLGMHPRGPASAPADLA